MKKVILIALVVILLIGGGLTAYIANLDWNTYKNDIASRFSNTMGKKIEFDGNLSVSIFPKPHISVKNVNILNPETSEKLASIQNIEAELSLKALLDGTPEIEAMSLIGAELWYIVNEKGISNWNNQNKGYFLDAGMEYHHQTVSVQNALIHYQNKKNNIVTDFEQFNADISAESFTGPYRIDGNFVNRDDHFGFAVGLGDISQTDDVFLNFAITHPRSNGYVLYDGKYNFSTGSFEGNFSGEFQQPATLVNVIYGQEMLPEMLNLPFIFSVHLKSDSSELQMSSLALKFAEIIEGSGNINIPWRSQKDKKPLIDIKYQFATLDIRPLLMGGKILFDAYKQEQVPYEPQTPYDISFDLAMQRMVIGDTADSALENVSFKGSWHNDELSLDEYYAACPGNVVWTMSGSLLSENQLPVFFVKSRIEGKNFATFARTFGINLTAPSQSAYRGIDAMFNIAGNPLDFVISDFKMILDKTQAEGSLKVDWHGEVAKYQLEFNADNINFDNYIAADNETMDLVTRIKKDLAILTVLQTTEWKVDASVVTAIFRGVPLKDVLLEFNNKDGIWHLTDFILGNVLGMQISMVADINGIGSDNVEFQDLRYKFKTQDISPIISKLGLDLPQWDIFKNKPMQAEGYINGNFSETNIETNVTVNKTQFSYVGKIAQNENFEFDGKAKLKTTNFGGLVNDLGGNWEKLKNNSAFNCGGKIVGNTQDWSLSGAECVLGTAKYSGDIQIKHGDDTWYANGNIKTSEFDLANFLEVQIAKNNIDSGLVYADDFINRPMFNRDVYNFAAYKMLVADVKLEAERVVFDDLLFRNVSTHIKNAQNTLRLEALGFEYDDALFNGELVIDYTKRSKVTGKLEAENIKLHDIGGKIYKITSGIAKIITNFTSAATSEEDFMNEFSGTVDFSVKDFGFNGLDFGSVVKDLNGRAYSTGVFQMVRDNLQKGHTDFTDFSGKINIKGGVWIFENTQIENNDVYVKMSGEDHLSDWRMHNEFDVKLKQLDLPNFSFVLDGQINKPTLDVNVEKLAEQYDSYWAEIERQKQAEKDLQQRELMVAMEVAQEDLTTLAARVNKLIADIDEYVKLGDDNEYRKWYLKQLEILKNISNRLDDMQTMGRQPDYTQDDIMQIRLHCKQYNDEVTQIENSLKTKHYEDDKQQISDQKDLAEIYKKENSNIYDEYQKRLQTKFSEILQYGETQELTNDENLRNMQLQMEDLRNRFWESNYKLSDDFTALEGVTEILDLDNKLPKVREQTEKLHEFSMQMQDLMSRMFENIDKIIAEKRAIYEAEEVRRQAIKQKEQEENKDNLLTKENGIAEEKMPETKVKSIEPQQVLRTVKEDIANGVVSGTIVKSYDEPQVIVDLPSTGLLRPLEGEARPVTGTIITK